MFRTPKFWKKECTLSKALVPLSWCYRKVSDWRYKRTKARKVSVPVICVGNLVMGGAGKTPTVIGLSKLFKKHGFNPHILSRGYGGYRKDAVQVKPDYHSYTQVGDESLLLAQTAPTWIGAKRVKSAKKAIRHGADIIIMDDGLQNPYLHQDLKILVIDTLQGVGNGRLFPAGPLREPIVNGIQKADCIITIGDAAKGEELLQTFSVDKNKTCLSAQLKAINVHEQISGKIMAFAGMGYPEKFLRTLKEIGCDVKDFMTYPDHHPYTITEIQQLLKKAKQLKVPLVTTEKDHVRIPVVYRSQILALPVEISFNQSIEQVFSGWLEQIKNDAVERNLS